MTLPVSRVTDRAFAMVRVGKYIVPQIGTVVSGARTVLAESAQMAYLTSRVVFPTTVGNITGRVCRRVLVANRQAALLNSTVTGGAIVGAGYVITAAKRVWAES